MRLLKRLLAGVSTLAMLTSPTMLGCYTVFAEEPPTTTTQAEGTDVKTTEVTTTVEAGLPTIETSNSTTEATTEDGQNIQTTTEVTETDPIETTTEQQPDIQKPNIDFEISDDDQWKWKQDTTGLILNFDDNVDIYYQISTEYINPTEDYSNASEWNGFENLEDGSYWIVFWAVSHEDSNVVTVSDTKHYQLDRTAPSEFELESNESRQGWNKKLIVSSKQAVYENVSGIQGIYYTVDADECPVEQQWKSVEYTNVDGYVDIEFELDLSLRNAAIVVYVVDNAGWQTTASLNVSNFDATIPEITSITVVGASFSNDDVKREHPNWTSQTAHKYGHEKLNNLTNYIYASDESYLKIVVKDNFDQLNFDVTINKITNTFSADDLVAVEGDYSSNGTYYIPLNAADFKLSAGDVFTVSVVASDSQNTSEAVELDYEVFYDPNGDTDSKITSSLSGNYIARQNDDYTREGLQSQYDAYFGATDLNSANKVSIYISDDIGLANYDITVNGRIWKSENLVTGIVYEGSYTETTQVTNADGETSTETTVVTVNYEDKTKTSENNPCEIPLENDGEYRIVVTVTDLAGNTNKVEYLYYVDTTAPTIGKNGDSSFSYFVEQGILRYFTFGTYGNESVTLSININDGGSGIDPNSVKLYWAPIITDETLTEYSISRTEGNKFIFNELPTSSSILSTTPYITISDYMGNESIYYFKTESGNLNRADAEELEKATLVLETYPPFFSVVANGSNYKVIDGKLFFGDVTDSVIDVSLGDNVGIDYYSIGIENQSLIDDISKTLSDGTAPISSDEVSIPISSLNTGEYPLNILIRDLTGYEVSEAEAAKFDTSKFYVDKTAPEIKNVEYSVQSTLLRYFTFGIFGNETISITVDIADNYLGSGINSVKLYWDKEYSLSANGDGKYTFEGLAPDAEEIPYIIVTDLMGNSNTYFFTTVDSGSDEKQVGQLILDDDVTRISLTLEDDPPVPNVNVPDSFTKYTVNGEVWYPGNIDYVVSVVDENSGLREVIVNENGAEKRESSVGDKEFISNRYTTQAEYTYSITEANDYTIVASAIDNAGNESEPYTFILHIDKENPQIKQFQFGGSSDEGTNYERGTYGFYFMVDTEARVYIDDPGVTSGFKGVTLSLKNVDGTNSDSTVDGGSLYTDSNGTYASFVIPMGFKGQVAAEVIDNVEHSSGVVNADGNIIEDADIHSRTSSIEIKEDVETDKTDADNVPLYNRSIPLTITVADSFSGISTIEWSIANDNKSGVISVANNGTIDAGGVSIENTEKESNLVTSIQFAITVDNNSNENVVNVKLTDRSGNTSESTKTYSIDTTSPTIQASIENSNPSGKFFNSNQTVNIVITERNFNASEVEVLLNGTRQTISNWSDNGSSVVQDGTTFLLMVIILMK